MTTQVPPTPGGMEVEFIQLFLKVRQNTMVDWERAYSLYSSVRYVVAAGVPGDLVECGVWKGGCCMLMALTLMQLGVTDRVIHLYDTFAGMSQPGDLDVTFDGKKNARAIWDQQQAGERNDWCYAGLDEVRQSLLATGYPASHLRFVPGRVEDTLPDPALDRIAVLRLDTDWYESSAHEMTHLYPRLSPGGVLICDDYRHWSGQKKAVDEYLRQHQHHLMLHWITTSAVAVKPA